MIETGAGIRRVQSSGTTCSARHTPRRCWHRPLCRVFVCSSGRARPAARFRVTKTRRLRNSPTAQYTRPASFIPGFGVEFNRQNRFFFSIRAFALSSTVSSSVNRKKIPFPRFRYRFVPRRLRSLAANPSKTSHARACTMYTQTRVCTTYHVLLFVRIAPPRTGPRYAFVGLNPRFPKWSVSTPPPLRQPTRGPCE